MIDVREIKLSMRYPESRQEDITDAFTRGYTGAVEIGNKAIKKLETENAKLLVERDEWHRVAKNKQDIIDHMRDARAENAKLRELVCKWYPHMLKRVGRDALAQWGQLDVLRELGVEVEDA